MASASAAAASAATLAASCWARTRACASATRFCTISTMPVTPLSSNSSTSSGGGLPRCFESTMMALSHSCCTSCGRSRLPFPLTSLACGADIAACSNSERPPTPTNSSTVSESTISAARTRAPLASSSTDATWRRQIANILNGGHWRKSIVRAPSVARASCAARPTECSASATSSAKGGMAASFSLSALRRLGRTSSSRIRVRVMSLREASIWRIVAAAVQLGTSNLCTRIVSATTSMPPASTKGLGGQAGRRKRRARSCAETICAEDIWAERPASNRSSAPASATSLLTYCRPRMRTERSDHAASCM
mmetsp:Transcript_22208/g.67433  ORF Transcript_22208/g.67433 Transcript_22208/m.67433 type:complete len:308 (+) Transcript_22208:412-1335(+)|eukprot:scaffold223306_cov31-Tisochrysis_lutea.AAC.2